MPAEESSAIPAALIQLTHANSLQETEAPHLLAYLATISDPRGRRGRRHPLVVILAMAAMEHATRRVPAQRAVNGAPGDNGAAAHLVHPGDLVILIGYGQMETAEAKEHQPIQPENQTLASITFQNYFRMYPKLSGMTGTALTEAPEFFDIYRMNVVSIPTNVPVSRIDEDDEFYKNITDKFGAIAKEIRKRQEIGQPVLVGTVSIEKSEMLSEFLDKEEIRHSVLNARFHESEAHIVAQAGRLRAVTIATNMAGRGTDILLGGNPDFMAREFLKKDEIDPEEATEDQWQAAYARARRIVEEEHNEVVALGGLHIVGTERHESRRIDNQLRGRAGRQGDPGSSRFFLSLEDDLMRIFAGDKVKALMQRLGMERGVAIESKMVSKRKPSVFSCARTSSAKPT